MANQSKNKPAIPAHEAPWRFWRHRLALLQFWRGRDKQWYFFGQQPDEHVRLLVRKHWWFLVQPGLPFAASAAVLFVILFFGFGTLHVYLTGGQIQIKEVGNPRTVRDALVGVWEEYKASKPKDAPPPVPKDIELTATLKQLGKLKDVPTLPDADKDLPPLP